MGYNDVISLRIDSDIKKAIEQIACLNDLDSSTILRQIIQDYLLDERHHEDIKKSIDLIAEKIREEREEEFLRMRYKQRTKDTRTIRTALYTLYYTHSIKKAIDSIDDAFKTCKFDKEQKKTLHEFKTALKNKDKEKISEYIKGTNSLKHVNLPDLMRYIHTL